MKIERLLCDKRINFAVAECALVAVAIFDLFSNRVNVDISVLLLAPISLIAWSHSRRFALVFAGSSLFVAVIPDAILMNHTPGAIALEAVMFGGSYFSAAFLVNLLSVTLANETKRARRDALTDALNAGSFHESVDRELKRARRYEHPLAIAFVDLDNLKRINDEHGHAVGDDVLRAIAGLMTRDLRDSDMVGRLGGDEFGILLPESDTEQARLILERLREEIERLSAGAYGPISASIGATTIAHQSVDADPRAVIRQADAAMYQAKRGGKNRLVIQAFVPAAEERVPSVEGTSGGVGDAET